MGRCQIGRLPSGAQGCETAVFGDPLLCQQRLERFEPGVEVIRPAVEVRVLTMTFQGRAEPRGPIGPSENAGFVQMDGQGKDLRMPGLFKGWCRTRHVAGSR